MTSVLNNVPIPLQDPIARPKRPQFGKGVDPLEGLLTEAWVSWFDQLNLTLESAPSRIKSVALTTQAASISATDLSGGVLSPGLYRLTYYTRITRAATTSSGLIVTLDWVDGGVACAFSGADLTGNTTATNQSGTILVHIDDLSPVRYSTTYASVGATSMQYSLDITLEEINA